MRELTSAQCVIFDFDGPLCRLFARRTAPAVAARLRETHTPPSPPGTWPDTTDPLRLLTAAFQLSEPTPLAVTPGPTPATQKPTPVGQGPTSVAPDRLAQEPTPVGQGPTSVAQGPSAQEPAPVGRKTASMGAGGSASEMERALAREESAAAESAFPTAYADALVRTLHATGRTLAVATDNSAAAAERYLAGRGLLDLFAGRVCGRVGDAGAPRLKPDPDCVLRALHAAGAAPADTVMIGDSPSDLRAAQAAGVAFIGYARNERKEAELRGVGAETVVDSLRDALLSIDPLAHV